MRQRGNDLERLNRLLDDLAAEREVAERAALTAADVELAETAAFLKAVDATRMVPSDAFVRRLGAHLATARQTEDQSGSRPTDRAVEAFRCAGRGTARHTRIATHEG